MPLALLRDLVSFSYSIWTCQTNIQVRIEHVKLYRLAPLLFVIDRREVALRDQAGFASHSILGSPLRNLHMSAPSSLFAPPYSISLASEPGERKAGGKVRGFLLVRALMLAQLSKSAGTDWPLFLLHET